MELIKDTLAGLLRHWAEVTPDKDFIIYNDRNLHWTYRQFDERVDRFAKGLLAAGVQKNSKVGIWANNVPDWLTVMFAAARIGAWAVTVNTNYKSAEVEYLMQNADIHTMCCVPEYRDSNYVEMLREIVPELNRPHAIGKLLSARLPELRNVVVLGSERYEGTLNSEDIFNIGEHISDIEYKKLTSSVNCHDIVNMQYTSGTTGFPKGVMLTNYNIVNNGVATGDAMKYTADDRLCVCVPFFHCFGIVLALCAIITHGASMAIVQDFDPEAVLKSVSEEKCTSLYGVPTMFVRELTHENFDKYDLSSLRTGIMAGSLCPIETMKQVMDKMYMKDIISVYGLTESSPGMTCSRIGQSAEKRATTVGTPFPFVEVTILNPETNHPVADGEQGEICCRGYNVMKGYYKNPEATAKTIDSNGWLNYGDLAMSDADGYYHITGRIKDMIIRGGENIYPREIENFIYQMPGVSMVEVVGIADQKYGEIVGAFIIQKEGANLTQEKVQKYCEGQIARFKIPKYVFFVDDYPKTGSGKVQKFKLREIGKQLVDEIISKQRV